MPWAPIQFHRRGELRHRLAAAPEDLQAHRGLAQREIAGDFPYVYLDGVILERSWSQKSGNLCADRDRPWYEWISAILGVAEGEKQDLEAGAGSCGTSRTAA
jgi:hypothetical protein